MCGFVGVMSENKAMLDYNLIDSMTNTLNHRGPDDTGFWSDQSACIALGHKRLSILDLSPTGHQPMQSPSKRYVLVFNGEIYNHKEIRNRLGEHSWIGTSDTETLLIAIESWGVYKTIKACIGMFAFAIWDNYKAELILGRDRMGEKPLYYGWQGEGKNACFLFGSELKAIKKHPSFSAKINRDSLCLFVRYNYISAPHSIYENIYKLLPGHILQVSNNKRDVIVKPYWSFIDFAKSGNNMKKNKSEGDIVNELEILLKSVIKQQMVADVPIGAFLSGGIDSSIIVALMQDQSTTPINTFTIGFNNKMYDEAIQAKEIANYLGTEHTELYVSSKHALEVIPQLPTIYCEPFADSSQIPTFLVSKLARKKVKVSLSGDAGDELFGGYNRYILTKHLWNKVSTMPEWMRIFVSSCIKILSQNAWNNFTYPIQSLLPKSLQLNNFGDKLYKGGRAIIHREFDDFYLSLLSHWDPDQIVLRGQEPKHLLQSKRAELETFDNIQKMMIIDTLNYLPDDILVKVDRASMGTSLESRIPFLDHRLVEFACQIPQCMKIKDQKGKWILREILNRYLPKELAERPKMGFAVPISDWLRGPLREWAESLLDENRLRQEGFFDYFIIRKKWLEHLSGKHNWEHILWNVLMFQSWLNEQ